MNVPVAMGSAEAMNFQPTGDGTAAITGDLVLTAQEVNPVLRALRDSGIEVTALHNHMLDDEPRLFFMHFWAHDDAAQAGQRPEERSRQDQRRAELALRKTPVAKAALRLLMAGLLVTLCASVRAEAPALQLERTIPLPEVTGRIDHMAIDLSRRRLFVAELGNNTVDVIDLASGKVAHRIEGLKEPQGIGYAPKADVIAIANAGDGSVRLFRGADFAPLGTVALGSDADNIRLNTDSGQIVVGYGEGGLATLDPASGSVVARAKPLRALRPTPPQCRNDHMDSFRRTRGCPSTVM